MKKIINNLIVIIYYLSHKEIPVIKSLFLTLSLFKFIFNLIFLLFLSSQINY